MREPCGKPSIHVAIDAPAPDETLSSVLDRAASFWGVDRSAVVAAMELGGGICDPDAPSPAAMSAIASTTGFSEESLDALVMDDSDELVLPARRISYCPKCWAEDWAQRRDPYFRRSWSYVASLMCERHGTLLYAWETDARGNRLSPPTRIRPHPSDAVWQSHVTHADHETDMRILKPLVAHASHAIATFRDAAKWPIGWRGNSETGRALIALLATNPAPYSERLAMDRLVPRGPDMQWFAGHRSSSRTTPSVCALAPIRRIGNPAYRRTLWWLIARTIVVGWSPLPIRGGYGVCIDIERWWRISVGNAISDHAVQAYRNLGHALGISGQGPIGDLFDSSPIGCSAEQA
jgi:hypothetical protein